MSRTGQNGNRNNNNSNYNNLNTPSRRKRKNRNNRNRQLASFVVLILLLSGISYFIYKIFFSGNNTDSKKSSISNSAAVSNANSGKDVTSSAVPSNLNTDPSKFWGNTIDFSADIQPLKGTKALTKWPAKAGFDIVKTDISSYLSKEYKGSVLKGVTVILDAGHGGEDLGAVYPRAPKAAEIAESKINLTVAKIVKEKLEKLGATVILTRMDNTYHKLYYRSAIVAKATLTDFYNKLDKSSKNKSVIEDYLSHIEQTIKANSDEDKTGWFYGLGVRREIKNIMDLQETNTNFLFLSLHCNSGENANTLHGTNVYYSTNDIIYSDEAKLEKDIIFSEYQFYNDVQRKKFATLLYENITQDSPEMVPNDPKNAVFPRNYAVIREQNLVSALIEMGFVNSTADRAFLLDSTKQEKISESIVKAIYEYYCKS